MTDHDDLTFILDVDRLIHEPSRLLLLAILYSVESADFVYLMRETALTKGNLSSHLAKLEEAGYIRIEKTYRGKTPLTICHLTAEGSEALETYRDHLKHLLACIEGV